MNERRGAALLMAGGAGLAAGSFLAWGAYLGQSATGMDGGDGWFTLVSGAGLLLAGYVGFSGRPLPLWVGWVALIVGAGVALINYFDITGLEGATIGVGMWIMLAGSAVALAGLLIGRRNT